MRSREEKHPLKTATVLLMVDREGGLDGVSQHPDIKPILEVVQSRLEKENPTYSKAEIRAFTIYALWYLLRYKYQPATFSDEDIKRYVNTKLYSFVRDMIRKETTKHILEDVEAAPDREYNEHKDILHSRAKVVIAALYSGDLDINNFFIFLLASSTDYSYIDVRRYMKRVYQIDEPHIHMKVSRTREKLGELYDD